MSFSGDEFRSDLEERAARVDDETGFAQVGELLGDDGGAPSSCSLSLGSAVPEIAPETRI